MRVLSLDPGAKRCGWAVLEREGRTGATSYVASGISGLPRDGNYQDYRLELIEYWTEFAHALNNSYEPQVLVSEIMPPVGGNIASIINRQLGLTVVTVVQAMLWWDVKVEQLGASTVKKRVTGTGKATKVKVRNGVLLALPELEPRRPEWTGKDAVWDEVDALAVGLSYLSGT